MNSERPYDLIIWGATGFTGQLVAEYINRQYGFNQSLKWAIAGRNKAKLETLRQSLNLPQLPIILADSLQKETLVAMVKQARVICSTVGPYTLFGTPLVEACVENQTDYCDLTGEVNWMYHTIQSYHEMAKANGTRIVHTCGFDSIPSDLGVYFLQQQAKARFGEYCQHIKYRLKGASGGISGGTYASLSQVLTEASNDRDIRRALLDPYTLNPENQKEGSDLRDFSGVAFDDDFQTYIAPFIMGPINTRVVRRSHALQDFPYGKAFQYDEAMVAGKGFSGRLKAHIIRFGVGLIMTARPNSMLRKLIDYFAPNPGQGPSKQDQESGFFKVALFGQLPNSNSLRAHVIGDRDPGYGSTSKMLGESAVCLALDQDKTPQIAGILTPATAMGEVLIERLEAFAGIRFEVKN